MSRVRLIAVAVAVALLGVGALLPASRLFFLNGHEVTLPDALLGASLLGYLLAILVLLFFQVWSFGLGVALAVPGLLGLGRLIVRGMFTGTVEAVRSLRDLEFVRPEWLGLLAFVPAVFWVSRKSLSGLGPVRKWTAVSLRAAIIALLAMALAEPRIRRTSDSLTVLFVADRSFSVPQDIDPDMPSDRAVDRRWDRVKRFAEESVRRHGLVNRDDQAGLILFGRRPKLVLPPSPSGRLPVDERLVGPVDGNYTDISAALKLALASFPEGTAKRIVLISDGNENIGSAEEQANIAKQNGVQIDAVALAPGYRNESEVLVQAVEAPPVSTQGLRLPVRVLVRNANPNRIVDGRLEMVKVGREGDAPVEIEDGPQVLDPRAKPPLVRVRPGLNVFRFRDRADAADDASFSYRATFIPVQSAGLTGENPVAGMPGDRPANNRASAAVVTRGQRRVLFLDEGRSIATSPHRHLLDILNRAKIRIDYLPAEKLPADRDDLTVFLTNYDCVVIANVPYERFAGDQAETLRSAVYDQGCGLIMVGGPDSFGPGGYQDSPIEAALPVDCEIKALKAAGKGGLVLIMHASEMADGNKWQKDIAKLAIKRLGAIDMVGVAQYDWSGGRGVGWTIPFQEVGENRGRLEAAIDKMTPGDMPDFDPFLVAAADILSDEKHALVVKHTILISDGDPQYGPRGQAAVAKMAENAITCTTVGVATHGGAEKSKLKTIAEGTKDGYGKPGNFYDVTNPNQLPAIYIKESRRVNQSFIFDKRFDPQLKLRGGPSEGLPNQLPPLYGFVRTTKKENPLVEMQIEGPQVFDQRFPVLASWRYGLGKAVAFTSDAMTQPGSRRLHWDRDWASSDLYQKFWEQVVNWSMREQERGRLQIVTEYRDGRIRITADVRDEKDKPVSGLTLEGKVSLPRALGPGEKPPVVEFKPKGAGLYEAEIPADEAGSYFATVQAQRPQVDKDGKVVRDANGNPVQEVYDAARAGVTVPYSPEFADLESNTPLMRRLAELTGGKFHTDDEAELQELERSGDLFREAPKSVRSLLPFWFWLVFAAGVLLLFDVGVRRISLEWSEVNAAAAMAWGKVRGRTEAADNGTSALDRLRARKAATAAAIDRERSARRFEPGAAAPSEPAPAGADEFASRFPTAPPPPAPPTRASQPKDDEDDPFARLRKAKQRAKHQKRDDEAGGGGPADS